jgi:protein-disulfide isomerase
MPPTKTEWILRSFLTAIAAVAIIGAAGAAYLAGHKSSPGLPGSSAAPANAIETIVGGSTAAAASTPVATPAPTPGMTQVAQTEQPVIGPDEHVLGKTDAPVTIIEYASMTCPHCAHFNEEVMPRIKSEFIDKGLVRFVFRPFPLDGLAARASLLAQCTPGADGYFGLVDVLFRSQADWEHASDPLAALKQIGRTAGIPEADVDRCINDQAGLNKIVDGIKEAQAKFGVDSTPSFVINGKKYTNMPFEDEQENGTTTTGFSTVIKGLLPKS